MKGQSVSRELGHSELLRVLNNRDEQIARGEDVVDLGKFEPFVSIDPSNGQEWLCYRKKNVL